MESRNSYFFYLYPFLFTFFINLLLLSPVSALTTISLVKALNAPLNPVPSGQVFNYNLAWSCPGAVSPADDCINMQITEPLPLTIQATALPLPDGNLSKVCIQNPGDPIPDITACSQPAITKNNPTEAGATLYFIFINRVTAGDSGSLTLQTRFPTGISPDGASAVNEATISGECDAIAVPGCVNPAPITSTSTEITTTATDRATINKTVLTNGAIDFNTIYRIRVCPAGSPSFDAGYLYPQNVIVTDTLPADATFISSNPAPDNNADPVLAWNIASLNNCQNIDITVNYAAGGSNIIGADKQNNVTFNYDPLPGSPDLPQTNSATHVLAGSNPSVSTSKAVTDSIVNVGQTTRYIITATNNGNIPLGITIDDPLPEFCQVTSFDVRTNATAYTVTLEDGTIINSGGTPTGIIPATDIDANALTDPNKYIAQIAVNYGDAVVPNVIPGAQRRLDITCNVIDPDRDGTILVLPTTITNSATIDGANDGTNAATQNPSRDVTIRDSAANPTFQADASKVQVDPAGIVMPGNNITFNIAMTNSDSYSSAPEQIPLLGPVFSDLLPTDMAYISSNLVGGVPAGCAVAPDISVITDYNATGRTLVIWSWAGKVCSLARGETITYDIVASVGDTTPGGTVYNNITFLGSDNPDTDTRGTESCSTSGGDIAQILTTTHAEHTTAAAANAANGVADEDRLCHAARRGFTVQRITNISSRKAVRGTLEPAYLFNVDEPNNVARTVLEGSVFWRLEINNTANIPLDHIEIIDIVPFDATLNPAGFSNSGVGTGAPLGSTWSPEFVAPIDLTATPAGTKVYYTQAANPCRDSLVVVPGCNPMVTLTDGVALTDETTVPGTGVGGEWSTVLPNIPQNVLAFRIIYPAAYAVQPGETLIFDYPMFIPLDAPITDCLTAADSSCSNIAWNTFGFSYEEADIGLANQTAPTRVGIIVQPLAVGTAALGNFVWHDTDQDGVQDADEASNGINFILVELFHDPDGIANNGDEILLTDTRTRNHPNSGLPGYFHFSGLNATGVNDRYIVRFHPPAGYDSSPSNTTGDFVDSDGLATNISEIDLYQVSDITLNVGQDRPDIDQGIFLNPPKFSIGNRVWLDDNSDSTDNDGAGGIAESATGIAGVTIELWSVDISGNQVNPAADATLVTNATGHYLFNDLDAGNYRVVIPASQFAGGQPLNSLFSSGTSLNSSGASVEAAPVTGNSDLDVKDHGALTTAPPGNITAGSVVSSTITLGPLAGEPTNEAGTKGPTQTPGYFDLVPDNRSNLSIDFGFYSLSVGNRLWFDINNNGLRDPAELNVDGVMVEILDGAGNVLGSSVSDALGYWRVDGLPSGSLRARVSAAAFNGGGVLVGYASSTGYYSNIDLSTDNADHGIDTSTPELDGVLSAPFNLLASSLILTEEVDAGLGSNGPNGDESDNLTVDFGFTLTGTVQHENSPFNSPKKIPTLSNINLLITALLLVLIGGYRKKMFIS